MWQSLLRTIALVKKELLAVLKDPRSRFSLLLPPLLQCLIFGYAATYDLNDVPYAVFDEDRSIASNSLLSHLDASHVFRRVATLTREADIATVIDNKDALLVIHLDQTFARNLALEQPASVQVIADGRNSNTAGVALSYVGAIVDAFNVAWRKEHAQRGPLVRVSWRAWYNPILETRWNMIPSLIGTITFMQTMMLAAMSIAREREEGTFDQLLVTPFRPMEIMIGKAIPAMLVGFVQATNVLLVALFWFRIPFQGSVPTLYAGLVLFLLAAVGIGIFLSSFASTMQQAMLYAFVLTMPFTLLSGLTTPVSNMPQVLQYFTAINPLRYAITLTQRVYLEGVGLETLFPYLWPMALIAAFTLGIATWMFRHNVE